MSKQKKIFVCSNCNASYSKWSGQCTNCMEWNSIEEDNDIVSKPSLDAKGTKTRNGNILTANNLNISKSEENKRLVSNISEFDRVCGNGLVPGQALLIGGDPGIGKSTLLLQVSANLSIYNKVGYFSGEESLEQIQRRASRLGINNADISLYSTSNVNDIIATIYNENFDVVIIDSIQTIYLEEINNTPGTVSQIKACASELIRLAKATNTTLIIIGHVTKEGSLAGPRVLEHLVDTVLYFEGDRYNHYRFIRPEKNRFGSTDEIGIFTMRENGLVQVKNPTSEFLSDNNDNASGVIIFPSIDGNRTFMLEVQALVNTSIYPSPKRSCVGFDYNRLSMIIAVIENKCGINISSNDIYINISGGVKVNDTGADLACAIAILSSYYKIEKLNNYYAFGEITLTGQIRNVQHYEKRIKEAQKLNFKNAFVPNGAKKSSLLKNDNNAIFIDNIDKIIQYIK